MLFPGIGACISQTLLCAKAIGVKGPVFLEAACPIGTWSATGINDG